VTSLLSPREPSATASRSTRILGLSLVVGFALLLYLAFVATPPEQTQGDAYRILYLHVPAVTVAYLGCLFTTVGSLMVLWKRSEWWDATALAAARVAAAFTAMVLVSGSIWGRATWGVYWVWDARLTSTAMLMVLLLGYLALRRLPADPSAQSRRAAVLGLLIIPNIILVHYSVSWWRSVHQGSTITRPDAQIDDLMLFTLFYGFVVFGLLFVWMMIHGFRVAWLERQVEAVGLEHAIAERRAEAIAPVPGAAR
jgi:heme exporter protein C